MMDYVENLINDKVGQQIDKQMETIKTQAMQTELLNRQLQEEMEKIRKDTAANTVGIAESVAQINDFGTSQQTLIQSMNEQKQMMMGMIQMMQQTQLQQQQQQLQQQHHSNDAASRHPQ